MKPFVAVLKAFDENSMNNERNILKLSRTCIEQRIKYDENDRIYRDKESDSQTETKLEMSKTVTELSKSK